jgi:hypothetical protein
MIALGLAACAMFRVKYQVVALHKDIARIHQEIVNTQAQLHLLQAEWVYISKPERIRALAEAYLALEPVPPTRIATHDTSNRVHHLVAQQAVLSPHNPSTSDTHPFPAALAMAEARGNSTKAAP